MVYHKAINLLRYNSFNSLRYNSFNCAKKKVQPPDLSDKINSFI